MLYRMLADLVVVAHFAFVVFAVAGAFLVLRWRWVAWVHLPVVAWAALIEVAGWVCPLTPLENWLRMRGGAMGDHGGFVEHYIIPILYPGQLTRSVQIALGALVLLINAGIYSVTWNMTRLGKTKGRR